ncbi:MAG: VOC family protein [Planctomycetota bacterium]
MTGLLTGLHHVTALAKSPTGNHRFYTEALGLRLVKKTVNFDDPLTYHLYYGDERGSPGTLLTHFPHPHAKRGVHGSPEITETHLAVASGSLGSWAERLGSNGTPSELREIGGGRGLAFEDPDGMRFALIEDGESEGHAISRVAGVAIDVPDVAHTSGFLRKVLGFRDGAAGRLLVGPEGSAAYVELRESAIDRRTSMGAGTVHHVAWRVPDEDAQLEIARRLTDAGVGVTPVQDRNYFRSIYSRIPGGVIFEVATDGPGFDVDEPLESLGGALKLPSQFEARRAEIERHLVPLDSGSGVR